MSPTAPTTTRRTQSSRTTAAKRAAATRRANARRRSAAAKKAAASRQLNQQRTPVKQAQDLAERAVLIPVGATLVARDRVIEGVTDAVRPYRTPELAQRKVERDLKRFERRGTTARNRVERRVKRTRTRVERELRQRRNAVQRVIKRNRTRVERETSQVRRDVRRQGRVASRRAGVVQARVDEAVSVGQKAVADAQERVASTVS